jgi:hypothetical protein
VTSEIATEGEVSGAPTEDTTQSTKFPKRARKADEGPSANASGRRTDMLPEHQRRRQRAKDDQQ